MSSQILEDFLTPRVEQLRTQIQGIDESYNNNWDILAELCQNSVDAIRQSNEQIGKIDLEVDAHQKKIVIIDNGIGIDPINLPVLLKPFSTSKRNNEATIGEKGVGLSFAMFSCNDFYIKSGNNNGTSMGSVKNALNWKTSVDQNSLPLEIEEVNEPFQGTHIELSQVDKNNPIFKLNFQQLKYVLRTKTALGSTKALFVNDKDIEITLTFTDQEGTKYSSEKLPFRYWLVTEGFDRNTLDIETYFEFRKDKTDSEKRRKLLGKIIYKNGQFLHNDQRIIKYVACFVPTRNTFQKISKQHGLCTEEQLENQEWLETFEYSIFSSGIYTSVKGMPTGITIDTPNTGASGYWYNIFILFDDSKLSFDIGRKSIHGSQARIYRDYSRQIFNDFYREVIKFIPEVDPEPSGQWNRDEAFAEIENLPDLNYENISFEKSPKDQEASVVGLFFECIGRGIIKDISPLTLGYKKKYDLFAHQQNNIRTIIEFKSKLRYIINDFSNFKKMFDEIDCIVCWNVDEDDIEEFNKKGLRVEEIETDNIFLEPTGNVYPNATHELIYSGYIKPIFVIDLKKVIESQ